MIEFDYDGHDFVITFEVWRIKEAFYKLVNRIWLRLGKGWFFIDCGYCYRNKGKMKCAHRSCSDDDCVKEKCRIFGGDGE